MAAIDPERPDALLLGDNEDVSFIGVPDAALGVVHRATITEKWRPTPKSKRRRLESGVAGRRRRG